jgi:ribose 1,5-bisphosphokinase
MPNQFELHFARRCITRSAQPNGEQNECVDVETFHRNLSENAFALHWHANGLYYGIRHDELAPLQSGKWVILNGSRAHLAEARLKFPDMRILHITASEETIRKRLRARGRETSEAIESRINRTASISVPASIAIAEVSNDGTLETAGSTVIRLLREWMVPSDAVATDA